MRRGHRLAASYPSIAFIDTSALYALLAQRTMTGLSDRKVLQLAEAQMKPSRDQRLSALPEKQQSGDLTEAERSELSAL
jgi:hypothetical protein